MGRLDMMIHGCLNLREDRACQLALEGYPFREGESRRSYRTPLSQTARTTLVSQALLMGGEGSYTRLIAHPELPLRDRLVYAAGVSDEELASHWRERIMAARPNAQAGLLRSPATLLVWLLFFALLATRSSRWRLG
jgi:hypothetical protein